EVAARQRDGGYCVVLPHAPYDARLCPREAYGERRVWSARATARRLLSRSFRTGRSRRRDAAARPVAGRVWAEARQSARCPRLGILARRRCQARRGIDERRDPFVE